MGTSSPEALLDTLWFNNTIHFGLRGYKEHRVKLHKTASGEEYLEYNERQTKTRSGENTRDVPKVTLKMFSIPGNERDPIAVYKLFAEQRPAEMNSDDSPFYLAVNNLKRLESLSNKAWFKKAPAGVNKLNSIMKSMAEKAGLQIPNLLTTAEDNDADIGKPELSTNRHYSTVGPQKPAKLTANGNVENPEFSRNGKPESFV